MVGLCLIPVLSSGTILYDVTPLLSDIDHSLTTLEVLLSALQHLRHWPILMQFPLGGHIVWYLLFVLVMNLHEFRHFTSLTFLHELFNWFCWHFGLYGCLGFLEIPLSFEFLIDFFGVIKLLDWLCYFLWLLLLLFELSECDLFWFIWAHKSIAIGKFKYKIIPVLVNGDKEGKGGR